MEKCSRDSESPSRTVEAQEEEEDISNVQLLVTKTAVFEKISS